MFFVFLVFLTVAFPVRSAIEIVVTASVEASCSGDASIYELTTANCGTGIESRYGILTQSCTSTECSLTEFIACGQIQVTGAKVPADIPCRMLATVSGKYAEPKYVDICPWQQFYSPEARKWAECYYSKWVPTPCSVYTNFKSRRICAALFRLIFSVNCVWRKKMGH